VQEDKFIPEITIYTHALCLKEKHEGFTHVKQSQFLNSLVFQMCWSKNIKLPIQIYSVHIVYFFKMTFESEVMTVPI
jgi:hypothetical protein